MDAMHTADASDAVVPTDASDASSAGKEGGTDQTMEVTFYGWDDNSPPGNAIAYPKCAGYPTIHDAAGGTGTYADPITFATDKDEIAIGSIVYAPFIEKYLVMEDDCGQCDTDWGSMIWHIDVWMNSNGTEDPTALENCEDQWTQCATTIVLDPPPGLTVTTNPLFDPATNTCRTTP
jgi:3D (Asp-Asp-Asp) domain-containing protein